MLSQFLQLLADNSSILRTVIECRKDQVTSMPWDVVPREGAITPQQKKRIEEIRTLLVKPDGYHRFSRWERMLLEDMFVIDSPTIYLHRDIGGKLAAMRLFQGDTIRVVIDDAGNVPDPPAVAYQQIIKGLPMVNFDQTEILFIPFNPRPRLPVYGFSNVEYVYLACTTEIRRELYQGQFYLEGNLPDLIMETPETWTAQQLAEYQAFFDQLLSGNVRLKSKVRFMPAGCKVQTPKGAFGELLKAGIDEWLARIICAAFRISPMMFVAMMNRATAQTHQEEARDEGLPPILNWLKEDIFDPIIQEDIGFGYDDLEFKPLPKEELDPQTRMVIDLGYLRVGVRSRNEVRAKLGEGPILDPAADQYMNVTPQGDIPIGQGPQAAGAGGEPKPGAPALPAPRPFTSISKLEVDPRTLLKYVTHSPTERAVAQIIARSLLRAKRIAEREVAEREAR